MLIVRNHGRTTTTNLDFGVAGVPVTRLELRAAAPTRYDRPVSVEVEHGRTTFVVVARGSDPCARPRLTAIELGSRYRYLRVTVDNGDDPPLRSPARSSARPTR